MIRPPLRKDIEEFASLDSENFKIFLISALRGYFEEGRGRHAFGVVAPFIGRTGLIPTDFEDIHDCLHADEQMAFREGCILALEDTVHCDSRFRLEIAENIISLAGLIRASRLTRVLPRVVNVLTLEVKDEEKLNTLFLAAFEAVSSAATPNDETVTCFYELADQRTIPPRLSSVALLRLIEAQPRNVAGHLERLWPQLSAAIGWPGYTTDSQSDQELETTRERNRARLVRDVFARVSPEDFVQTLNPTKRMLGQGVQLPTQYIMLDDWWYQTVNSGTPEMTEIVQACSVAMGLSAGAVPSATEPKSTSVDEEVYDSAQDQQSGNWFRPYSDILKMASFGFGRLGFRHVRN